MRKYRFLEHTADALFRAYGGNFRELLENSAEAMCSVMYDLGKVKAKTKVEVGVEGKNREELLHNFLGSVLFEMQSRGMLFARFKVKELDENSGLLKAALFGEKMNAARHGLKTEVKAVTWHKFFARREGNKWVSQVLLDV
jgi:SHS2 domain-containing protein